jgi:tetratricopeptide (TPR) repeat protein
MTNRAVVMTDADVARSLLFAALALEDHLIDRDQLAQAWTAWTLNLHESMADLLTRRGLISAEVRREVDRRLECKLTEHQRDPAATLDAITDATALAASPQVDHSNAPTTLGSLTLIKESQETLVGTAHPEPASPSTVQQAGVTEATCPDAPPAAIAGPTAAHAPGRGVPPATIGSETLIGPAPTDPLPNGHTPAPVETLVGPTDTDWSVSKRAVSDRPSIPGYEVQDLLGRGGMGVVYRAVQKHLKRPVALKMVRGDLSFDPGQVERFRVEAESIASLRHPNVVQIYEIGESGGVPYFSLEMLEGGTLARRLSSGPMVARAAATLTATLARTIAAVHRVGIIHRDLKPSNVLFDVDGTPKVTDFGLAKRLKVEDGQTLSGEVMGTPSYMAPEQAEGLTHQIGPPVDIYALGAILYEMLTGRPPFRGPTILETLRQVVFEDPVPPSRLQSRVSRDLETICLKCLAKAPARRYATADDLADDLDRFLAGEPIRARPTPFWERAAKWARRRPTAAALTAAGVVAAVGLAVAAQWYNAYQQDQARRREEQVTRMRMEGLDDLDRGRRQRARGELADARVTLTSLLAKLRPEPSLADLGRRAQGELDEVQRLLAADAARSADQEGFARFGQLHDQALLLDGYAAVFPETLSGETAAGESVPGGGGRPAPARREAPTKRTRAAARGALAVFAPAGDGPGLMPVVPPGSLSPEQRAEVESGGYLMLMVLSEAVARPLPGEDPRRQAEEALAILDRTTALRPPSAAFYLRRADILERRGDARAAGLERARAAGLKPADAFDDLLLGRERFLKGDWDAARPHFEAALSRRPDLFWARCLLAIAELNSAPSRPAEAKTELTTCLLAQPSYAWLYLLRGSAYGQVGVTLGVAARAAGPGSRLAAEAEARFQDAEADFRKAHELGLDEGLGYVLLMNRGVMRFQRGSFPEATADFERAIALDKGRYNAYASLAQVLRKLGRKTEAVERLDQAIALEPRLAGLYRGRALARLDGPAPTRGETETSLRDLETSARLEPAGSRAAADDHARRGRLLLRLDRPADALAAADTALAMVRDSGRAHLVRVGALLALERYDDVLSSCDAALAAGHPSAELFRLRGLARFGRKDFAGAIDDYTQALALPADDRVETYRGRGWAHLFSNAAELALRDFDAALRLDPADPDGYAGRGAARVRLGDLRGAVADAEESIRREGRSARLLYIAAETLSLASVRAAAEANRRGRVATRDSLAYEARATELLDRSLGQTPADRKPLFWREVVARDPALRPLFQNPKILRRLEPAAGTIP